MNKKTAAAQETKNRILLVAMNMIREKGFTATRVDEICAAAGITKGAFFHHFKSKDDMAQQAAQFFSDFADNLFRNAPYQSIEDPVERLLGYIDFRHSILEGEVSEFTCLLGTMVQEVHFSHPEIREACQSHIWGHAETLVPTIQEAIDQHPRAQGVDARDLALFTQSVLQGAFILSKASQSPEIAQASVRHLRRYVQDLFRNPGDNDSES